MNKTQRSILTACLITLAAAASPAFAKGHGDHRDDHWDKHWKDHDPHGHGHGKGHDDHHDHVVVVPQNRVYIQQYYQRRGWRGVPPGHARHFIVGQPLPPAVVYQPIPVELYGQLQPVPVGYQYVQVDQNVLLINQASHEIVDAITLLSAVR